MSAEELFSKEQVQVLSAAIAAAERRTSGEIRVHIEKKCPGEALKAAENWFGKLGMHKTEFRNGILVYLAVESRVFAVYGDQGIHEKVTQQFWDDISADMQTKFRDGKFTEGLAELITRAGAQLAKYFPAGTENKDELTNDVSFQ